ncbi:ClpP family protease [Devriesea agamarum]|uniref:ClpP family protease n=1 Tax=Devriesea agamarum TaxID=472569 RepID=UPI00071D9873|nr:ATP-dependent Clp protease proteolytic subunit [Devriesea agamarum]
MTNDEQPAAATQSPFGAQLSSLLFHRRILLLDRELDESNGAQLSTSLILLAADDPRTEITLLINSPGGQVPAMLGIGDLMSLIPCDVRTVALGMAASAGQYLLSAGTKGKRYALPHSRILMHQGSAGFGGTAVDIEIQAEDLRQGRDTMIALTAAATGQPIAKIAHDSERDRWWDAEAARDYGFIDHVVASLDEILPGGFSHPTGMTSLGPASIHSEDQR